MVEVFVTCSHMTHECDMSDVVKAEKEVSESEQSSTGDDSIPVDRSALCYHIADYRYFAGWKAQTTLANVNGTFPHMVILQVGSQRFPKFTLDLLRDTGKRFVKMILEAPPNHAGNLIALFAFKVVSNIHTTLEILLSNQCCFL